MRKAEFSRKTFETDIVGEIDIDGTNKFREISTGIGFFDHMLTSFSVHSGFSLKLICKGDLEVDGHHTVEDCGIVLGKMLNIALGDKSGINRFGLSKIPMDEALAECTLDLSNRPFLVFNADFSSLVLGGYDFQLTEEFFRSVAFNTGITLHLNLLYGKNDHHKTEALFKSFAHAIKMAVIEINGENSSKGIL